MDHTGPARATKYIFVSGGVVSSVGKGITVASIGRLLKARGISVCILKLDPYINVDPGTMSPYQHGEVFVTDDGAETDLDLGHYERFIDENLTRASNVTTGAVYSAVIARERRGDFLGGTIQVVPHVTNEIKDRIERVARATNADVIIAEVGGTVGDIECQPFLEALRQIHRELEPDRTLFVHVTLLPYVGATGELKTKPTQHSVKELRSIGIQPDVICARSDYPVPDDTRDKIALFCDVDRRAVVPLETADTIYSVPLILEEAGLGDYIVERLRLASGPADLEGWRELVHRSRTVKDEVVIGVVGKYVELQDAYISVREAIYHAAWSHNRKPVIKWIDSQLLEQAEDEGERVLEGLHGIIVPGGFGYRGVEGKIRAARFARQNKVPYLGLCLGMQVLCIEFARQVMESAEANSTEFNLFTRYPVIDLLPEQRDVEEMGATMRLGVYPCALKPGTRAALAYDEPIVFERHRHRYEFNNTFREMLGDAGLVYSGTSPDGRLVEIAELRDHPFMLGSQFHPELKSRPNRPHPLFRDFVGAAAELAGEQLPLDGVAVTDEPPLHAAAAD
ncbi:MAG: CTP synthase [Chloroflexi bacterium]|nr:CTP synthase [Chloroflexota bacterium]